LVGTCEKAAGCMARQQKPLPQDVEHVRAEWVRHRFHKGVYSGACFLQVPDGTICAWYLISRRIAKVES
jgi:hypothetical protein